MFSFAINLCHIIQMNGKTIMNTINVNRVIILRVGPVLYRAGLVASLCVDLLTIFAPELAVSANISVCVHNVQ
jgi:hypothetical protein